MDVIEQMARAAIDYGVSRGLWEALPHHARERAMAAMRDARRDYLRGLGAMGGAVRGGRKADASRANLASGRQRKKDIDITEQA